MNTVPPASVSSVFLAVGFGIKMAVVKVKVKVKFTLEQVTNTQRWSRSIALLFL
jgi:hypothetical protein